jgi:hypothetical protein
VASFDKGAATKGRPIVDEANLISERVDQVEADFTPRAASYTSGRIAEEGTCARILLLQMWGSYINRHGQRRRYLSVPVRLSIVDAQHTFAEIEIDAPGADGFPLRVKETRVEIDAFL